MNENEHVTVFSPTFPDLRTSFEAPGPLPPAVVSFAWAPLPVTVLRPTLTGFHASASMSLPQGGLAG